ncbi:hypothetical protein KS4_01360 [Poriferisphaera corsica]|uniref:Uncharacterized protein n=1 Tax=Poriferisphaera corsica TaxID=2528020 RepID=A0A517YPF8_9BACT|nr:hypothetical protein KS4_01360 [Poriferisphaera corsica]
MNAINDSLDGYVMFNGKHCDHTDNWSNPDDTKAER